MTARKPLRYGLTGTGMMGQGHIGALKAIDGVELVAIADPHEPNRTAALEKIGSKIPAYQDQQTMIGKEQLDAVIVATPDCAHTDVVCDALDAGLCVLGEKPMATTIEDCNRIVKADRNAEGFYQVGLELRYSAIWQRTREMLTEGRIGKVRQMWCKEFRGPWAFKVDQWITQQAKSGGTFLEKDCHHFDLFNWFADAKPESVTGFGTCDLVYGAEYFKGVTPDVLDNAQAIVSYDSGAMATLMVCMYCTGCSTLEIGLIGTEGWIVAETGTNGDHLTWFKRGGEEKATFDFELPADIRNLSHAGSVYLEHQAFRDNILNHTAPLTNADVAWESAVVGLAAERAVKEKRIVKISEYAKA